MSTLGFFIAEMPGYNPSFFVGFLWSILLIFCVVLIIIYGHKLTWGFKNNLIIFILVPITLSLPIFIYYLDTPGARFAAYAIILLLISVLNSL
jgi:heme/copper-type cytochrome/quinol oxidase subunit 4